VSLRISLAGRLAVEAGGVPIDEDRFHGRQGRIVFAYLVTELGRPVPREELAGAVWGETPPVTWEKGLTVIVSRLRALLTETGLDGPKLLSSAFGCYRLDLPEDTWVDVLAATSGVDEARRALAEGDLERAEAEAGTAASLTRQRFLPGEDGPWVDARRGELDEVRSDALLCLGDVSLRAGRPAEAVKHAEEAVALEPFRESGYRRLMEAHAAGGNRAEALRVYERCRRLLADELGAYPSPETESIYRELLRAPAPEPAAPARLDEPAAPRKRRRRLRVLVVSAALVAGAVAAALAFAFSSGSPGSVAVEPDSVAVIDPQTNRVVASVPVGARPTAVAVGEDAVWVASADDGTVSRIDPDTQKVVKTIGIGAPAIDLAVERDDVWVATGTAGTIAHIDPRENAVTATVDLKGSDPFLPNSVYAVAADGSAVWIAAGQRTVLRMDGRTHEVVARIDVGFAPVGVAVGEGATWTATTEERVLRIEPSTNAITARIPTAFPVAVAAGEGAAWVAMGSDSVWRIDPASGAVVDTIPVGKGPLGVAAGGGSVWVANGGDGTLSRIDPRTSRVVATVALGYTPSAVSAGADAVWVTVQREPVT
jgi:YVTN family beta-propeller protein